MRYGHLISPVIYVSMIVNNVSSVREKHLNLSEVDLFFAAMSVKFYTFDFICLVWFLSSPFCELLKVTSSKLFPSSRRDFNVGLICRLFEWFRATDKIGRLLLLVWHGQKRLAAYKNTSFRDRLFQEFVCCRNADKFQHTYKHCSVRKLPAKKVVELKAVLSFRHKAKLDQVK